LLPSPTTLPSLTRKNNGKEVMFAFLKVYGFDAMSSSLRKSPMRDLHAQGVSGIAIHVQFATDPLLPSLMLHPFLPKLHSDAAMVLLSKANNYDEILALSCEKVNLDTHMLSSPGSLVHINLGSSSLISSSTSSSLYSEIEITDLCLCFSKYSRQVWHVSAFFAGLFAALTIRTRLVKWKSHSSLRCCRLHKKNLDWAHVLRLPETLLSRLHVFTYQNLRHAFSCVW